MRATVNTPWKRYALIAELAKRFHSVSPQFGKTVLQKIVYFLQEIYRIDCGYDFSLYTYGPYDSQLLSDLDIVEHWGCVSVQRVNDSLGGYNIVPTKTVDTVRNKAVDFLDDIRTKTALNELIEKFGAMTARDLELRATIAYVAKSLQGLHTSDKEKSICELVQKIKPKFSLPEIERATREMIELMQRVSSPS